MAATAQLPPTSTRVERNTDPGINERIRMKTDASVAALEQAEPSQLSARLSELDREWDVERLLQANASTLIIIGTLLGLKVDRRFLLLPTAVLSFFLQHALQGWCPPIPVFRRLGVRTAREIDRERYALKALRGDFDNLPGSGDVAPSGRVSAVLRAVDA
jgi:hypothetical protein